MSLWIKRAKSELRSSTKIAETISRVAPFGFEDRRALVGVLPYKVWRWGRFIPLIIAPFIVLSSISESRAMPQENAFTLLHLWLADHGFFRHDSIKALNPAFDKDRDIIETRQSEKRYRFTSLETISDREARDFMIMNEARKSKLQQK